MAEIKQDLSSVVSNSLMGITFSLHTLSSENSLTGGVVQGKSRDEDRCSGRKQHPGDFIGSRELGWRMWNQEKEKGSMLRGISHIFQLCQRWGNPTSAH